MFEKNEKYADELIYCNHIKKTIAEIGAIAFDKDSNVYSRFEEYDPNGVKK